MKIVYTHHANQRMRQRKVSSQQVEETLSEPDHLEAEDTVAMSQFVGTVGGKSMWCFEKIMMRRMLSSLYLNRRFGR